VRSSPRDHKALGRHVAATDKAIAALVHKSYGLTEKEVEIAERGTA